MIFETVLATTLMQAKIPTTQLTVYNQGFALVKDVRNLDLKSGLQSVAIEDVAQLIEADSVAIRSLSAPGSFTVLEQNYRYDLISTSAILQKAVGGKIILNRVLPDGKRERIEGTLLSSPTAVISGQGGSQYKYNGMVLRTDDGRILLDPSGEVEVKTIPDGLISKPTLVWELDNEKAGSNQVELSYITQGMAWTADYVLQLDSTGKKGDMKGWVTMRNNSGATFENVVLKLLAGDVQRVQSLPTGGGLADMQSKGRVARSEMIEEQFADYHLYTLPRPATVRNNEAKQLSLMEAVSIPILKKIIFDPMINYGGWQPNEEGSDGTGIVKPIVRYIFTNDEKSNLGMPLPEGRVKIYQHDKSGATQLLGEDRIDHTPKDEKLSITVGRAFDIVCERKRTGFRYIYGRGSSPIGATETFETELRNRKEVAETVTLLERYWGDWKVVESTEKNTKVDANTTEFTLTLKPGEVRKLKYIFETRWAKN